MCYPTGPIMHCVGYTFEWDSKIQGNCSCVSTIGQNLRPNANAFKIKTLEIILICEAYKQV